MQRLWWMVLGSGAAVAVVKVNKSKAHVVHDGNVTVVLKQQANEGGICSCVEWLLVYYALVCCLLFTDAVR